MTTVEPGAREVFTQGWRRRPRFDRLPREQPGAEHHGGVGGVGAAGDRRDHHVAVVELDRLAVLELDCDRVVRPDVHGEITLVDIGARLAPVAVVVLGRRVGGREGFVDRLVAAVAELLSGLWIPFLHRLEEGVPRVGESDAVLGALRSGDARFDVAQVQLEGVAVGGLLGVGLVEEALLAGVGVDELDLLGRPPGELEVAERLGVDREDRAGRAELRRHVADRRPVGEAEARDSRPEELDELGDDPPLPEHLRDGQDEVGRGGALAQLPGQPEADHLREEHRDRLAEHRGLGLDPAHAPAQDAEAVDHRGVGVGADEGVGERLHPTIRLARPDALAEVLEVDLMADAGCRRHHPETLEGGLAPAQERVALPVSLVVSLGVHLEGALVAERVDLHRVVDDQIDVDLRVDRRGVPAQLLHRVAHRRQVDHGRDSGEVLHQHPGGLEGDLDGGIRLRVPAGDRLDVVSAVGGPVLQPQGILEQDLERVRQPRGVELLLEGIEPVDLEPAARDLELGACSEAVAAHKSSMTRGA